VRPYISPGRKEQLQKLFSIVDKVHCVAKEMENRMISDFGLERSKSFVNEPAIHIGRFKFRQRSKLSNKLVLITNGRLVSLKGYIFALLAIRRLISEGIELEYRIIGSGSEIDNILFYLDRLNLTKHVSLLGSLEPTEVMKEISETITPQGILAICKIPRNDLSSIPLNGSRKFIYLSEVQDPGNAGTILRSADAFGMDAVITSPGSVDMYSPKVVRSTAGSLWHIPVFESVAIQDLLALGIKAFSLGASGTKALSSFESSGDTVAVFGNEARGLSTTQEVAQIEVVSIPMPGNAESLNLSAAASIVMYHLSNMPR
jgi:TrmH family RNA methyltransferase